jgi:hypothetical protein
MTVDMIHGVLGWCSIINIVILLIWFAMITLAHDKVYKLHSKWFNISKEKFDEIHYAGMAFFKMSVFVLNVVPYIALSIIT